MSTEGVFKRTILTTPRKTNKTAVVREAHATKKTNVHFPSRSLGNGAPLVSMVTSLFPGTFHLLHLMFDDYVMYVMENLHSSERANDLLRSIKGEAVECEY